MRHYRYITFGNAAYDEQIELAVGRAPCRALVYDDAWLLEQEFPRRNYWLWEHRQRRGCGWYAWKPYVILHALENNPSDAVVLYVDADTYPVVDIRMLFKLCEREGGVLLFEATGHSNHQWCKRDCYIVMDQDVPRYHECQHAVARFCAFQKSSWLARQILYEWLTYCVNPRANTFDPSVLASELPGFKEHRCEQAILTLLAHKHGVRLHREACQAGNSRDLDWDLYPQLFWQVDHEWHETLPVQRSKFRDFE